MGGLAVDDLALDDLAMGVFCTVTWFEICSVPPVFLGILCFDPVAPRFWPNLGHSYCLICHCSG